MVTARGAGASQNHESNPTSPSALGLAITRDDSSVQPGIGGAARAREHATRSGLAFCTLSKACTWMQPTSAGSMPLCVIVRGCGVESSCSRSGRPSTVSHDV